MFYDYCRGGESCGKSQSTRTGSIDGLSFPAAPTTTMTTTTDPIQSTNCQNACPATGRFQPTILAPQFWPATRLLPILLTIDLKFVCFLCVAGKQKIQYNHALHCTNNSTSNRPTTNSKQLRDETRLLLSKVDGLVVSSNSVSSGLSATGSPTSSSSQSSNRRKSLAASWMDLPWTS